MAHPWFQLNLVRMIKLLLLVLVVVALVLVGCATAQRKLLYYPTHHDGANGLVPWRDGDLLIGYAREVANPRNVWLMLHGNAGQASDRAYALPCFADDDSVYIMEYPGYGARPGSPSKTSFNAAAAAAYRSLRKRFADKPVCVVAESIGSGPACTLASLSLPPDKFVLIVPFDTLAGVAADHFRYLPVTWMLRDNWNNIAALAGYRGPVEIFGAEADTIIPIRHARALAQSVPQAVFHRIRGGHNDWSTSGEVVIRANGGNGET
ncbi:MAG TPA: alpha/beta hydrolase, partial [Opitutaceae bacterium]|nr:alpha/beta hydrolase [Opitutaceae bacterium]